MDKRNKYICVIWVLFMVLVSIFQWILSNKTVVVGQAKVEDITTKATIASTSTLQRKIDHRGQSINYAKEYRMVNMMKHKGLDHILRIDNTTCLNQEDPFEGWTSGNDDRDELTRNYLPYGVLLGAQKSGTTSLHSYLVQHPDVLTMKKEVYILDRAADGLMIVGDKNGIPQAEVRRQYHIKYAPAMRGIKNLNQKQGKEKDPFKDKIILDMSPNYLYESDRVPARLTCILPWAKVFILLRDPVERAFSQYAMKLKMSRKKHTTENGHPIPTFDEYIQTDLAALKESGVIQNWEETDFDDFFGSDEEFHAWRLYSNSGLNSPIGFGLYALQIAHFLKEFDRVGKPRSDLLVLKNADLDERPLATFHRLLDFLGLQQISLPSFERKNVGTRTKTMSRATEKLLKDTFEPYNRKLVELLGSEWSGVWTKDE